MHLSRRSLLLALAASGALPRHPLAQGAPATLTVSQFSETRDLSAIDPMRSLDFTIPTSLIFDPLLERDAEGHLVPALATAWERVAPTTWRFTIRGDARFHDGSLLTARDAAATFAFLLDPANRSGLRLQVQPMQRAEAPDDTTLLLHTSVPTGLLPQIVGAVPVLSAAQLAAPDAPFRTRPIGSGPWRLAAWRPGERVELEATGAHWAMPAPGFGRITVRAVPEASTRVADLLSGGAQIAGDIPPGLAARVARGARLVMQPGARTQYLSFWFRPPFDDARVRLAVHHAIDRKALAEATWGAFADVATGVVPTGFGGYTEAFPLSDHDPDRARALLREAGITTPLAVELDTPPAEIQAAQVLQAQLARGGFAVRINPLESIAAAFDARRLAAQERGRMFVVTALDNHAHDAVRPFTAFYAENGFLKGSMGYKPDARMAALLSAYMAEGDAAARLRAAEALMAVAKADAPASFLAFPKAAYGVAAGVEMPRTAHGRLDFAALRPRAA
ncbi:ABC transporter substrate-binding protein [Falsiroseomonas tokyonensis]|uniref:ABC transporter substrate-binding protein n=1 Tax=Falsiroseomonas tokyonensis TaxID=430521 RepID=A0ABV7BRW7_9PROT|nr:ABC transporter substrate-binding protein [Falsiroseomonas tokyonensis]MBU8536828.1 ABC transporter substrate-binding protein [Falsiroseomonas tokyonensis]